MEIINYSENNGLAQVSGLLKKATLYQERSRSYSADTYSTPSPRLYNARPISVRKVFENTHKPVSKEKADYKKFLKLLLLVPFLAICVAVPYFIIKMISFDESYATAVEFDTNTETEEDILRQSLSTFALQPSPYFDNEGNVLTSDGTAIELNVSFKDPVSFSTYTVKSGDTISGISLQFGLSNISTLIAVNNISNVRELHAGQKLSVPSMDGIFHVIEKGESLEGLSAKYGVTVEDLLDVNDLESFDLGIGEKLFIPGARMETLALQKAMGEIFVYPLKASWRLTSKFGSRPDPFTGVLGQFHGGIDMACPKGTPIYAAMSGTVVTTGYSNVYGNYVIIKHIDGYQTLYGHMSKITTRKDAYVSQGSQIGLVGSTGASTGPHLHFTVYKDGKRIDPLSVLK